MMRSLGVIGPYRRYIVDASPNPAPFNNPIGGAQSSGKLSKGCREGARIVDTSTVQYIAGTTWTGSPLVR